MKNYNAKDVNSYIAGSDKKAHPILKNFAEQ